MPGILQREPISVSKLNEYVSILLGRDPLLRNLRVIGEISGFKRHSSGHLYFSLKDEGSLVRCVMFRQSAQTLTFRPQDGMRVVLTGYASLYARDGQYQLYAQAMSEEGEGELYRKFLLLKTRLEAKGYFDPARKRPIPFLPRLVGVITSQTGAAVHDITEIIHTRFPNMPILLCPVAVQGAGAAQSIAEGIAAMNRDGQADVLIVGRGGGSLEDLWAFNELPVAEAIYHSEIPVISAVGHETDFSIADFVADVRAATPSAAAAMAVPEYDQLLQRLDQSVNRLGHALGRGVEAKKNKVKDLLNRGGVTGVPHKLSRYRQRLEQCNVLLAHNGLKRLENARGALMAGLGRLTALGPGAVLARGYSVVQDETGAVLKGVQALQPGMAVRLMMQGGRAHAKIESIEEGETHGTTKAKL